MSEETLETVEGEMHAHKVRYLKYKNNNWKGERASRHGGAKDFRHTVSIGNKVARV